MAFLVNTQEAPPSNVAFQLRHVPVQIWASADGRLTTAMSRATSAVVSNRELARIHARESSFADFYRILTSACLFEQTESAPNETCLLLPLPVLWIVSY